MVYLVSYDLMSPGQDYPELTERLQQLGAVRVLESTWLLISDDTPAEIGKRLRAAMDLNDGLLVVEVKRRAAWARLLPDSTTVRVFLDAASRV